MLRIPALLSDALLAYDVYVCLERPSGALEEVRAAAAASLKEIVFWGSTGTYGEADDLFQ